METGIKDDELPWASVLRATEHLAVRPGSQGNHHTSQASARGWASLSLPLLEFCEKEHGVGTSRVPWSKAALG